MRKLSKFMGGAAKEESKLATSPMPPAHEQGNREWHGLSTQDRLKQALTQRKVADSALASARNRLKEDRSRLEDIMSEAEKAKKQWTVAGQKGKHWAELMVDLGKSRSMARDGREEKHSVLGSAIESIAAVQKSIDQSAQSANVESLGLISQHTAHLVQTDYKAFSESKARYYVLNKQLEDVEKRLHGLEQDLEKQKAKAADAAKVKALEDKVHALTAERDQVATETHTQAEQVVADAAAFESKVEWQSFMRLCAVVESQRSHLQFSLDLVNSVVPTVLKMAAASFELGIGKADTLDFMLAQVARLNEAPTPRDELQMDADDDEHAQGLGSLPPPLPPPPPVSELSRCRRTRRGLSAARLSRRAQPRAQLIRPPHRRYSCGRKATRSRLRRRRPRRLKPPGTQR